MKEGGKDGWVDKGREGKGRKEGEGRKERKEG